MAISMRARQVAESAASGPAVPGPVIRDVQGDAPRRRRDRRVRTLDLSLNRHAGRIAGLLGDPDTRPGIAGTAYDTAWLASVSATPNRSASRFPSCLQWLVEHQQVDGSWGGTVRYEHDRILSTLAAIAPLAAFGRREADYDSVQAATRYLWQRGHLLASEPVELVGFELLLPALVRRAQRSGVAIPPNLDIYAAERASKLLLLPRDAFYSPAATIVHSLEFLGDDADIDRMRLAQASNGSIGNSPATTAFFYGSSGDERALRYLEDCVDHAGGAMAPVLHPCETFELLWSAYPLFLAGVPTSLLLGVEERLALRRALALDGVSLSPSFPIPDADDTAVALILLNDLGEPVSPRVLDNFLSSAGYFASFPHERHSSTGVNLHVLHALLRVPGYPDASRMIDRLIDYLVGQQQSGLYWFDKWHISPYYATAHALRVFAELPDGHAERARGMADGAREWIRQTQASDGSWGFYNQSTAEETAYAILGLTAGNPASLAEADRDRCARGIAYLRSVTESSYRDVEEVFPPLWVDKCLYTPTLVVQAAVEAANLAYLRAII